MTVTLSKLRRARASWTKLFAVRSRISFIELITGLPSTSSFSLCLFHVPFGTAVDDEVDNAGEDDEELVADELDRVAVAAVLADAEFDALAAAALSLEPPPLSLSLSFFSLSLLFAS